MATAAPHCQKGIRVRLAIKLSHFLHAVPMAARDAFVQFLQVRIARPCQEIEKWSLEIIYVRSCVLSGRASPAVE